MTDALVTDLAARFGTDRVASSDADRSAYAHDLWPRQLIATRGGLARPPGPRAVVWPTTRDELTALVTFARTHGIALVPFGAGSGVTGGIATGRDSVAVDVKRMRSLHRVDLAEGVCEADAGILGEHLEEKLRRRGATLGHFPSSIYCSTLGGWLATRSAGQCSGRYGKIEDMVLALEGVLGTGEPFTAGVPRPGTVDTRPLIVGSEGTFGFITRATMRVWPAPTAWHGLAYTFATMLAAWEAMRGLYQSGLRPAVTRLYDPFDSWLFQQGGRNGNGDGDGDATRGHHAVGALGGPSQGRRQPLTEAVLRRALDHPGAVNALAHAVGAAAGGRSLLIVGFEGTDAEPHAESVARARSVCARHGGRDAGDGLARRWLARRHAVSYRQPPAYARGVWVDTMEVAAPWSRLEALYHGVREALGGGGFVMAHMSHAYPDGCSIYFTFMGGSPDDTAAAATYDATWARALGAAHAAGGTVAHHHGVGRSKRAAMALEWGDGVRLLDALRGAADPDGVLVRGALVPTADERPPAGDAFPMPAGGVSVDTVSRLVIAAADAPLAVVAETLAGVGLTAPWTDRADTGATVDTRETVGRWLAQGAPGWHGQDPVDHLVAGWRARLPSGGTAPGGTAPGGTARWVPAPRRSAGPDVLGLVARDPRFGTLEAVALRVRGADETGPAWVAPYAPGAPAGDGVLEAWIERAAGVLGAAGT